MSRSRLRRHPIWTQPTASGPGTSQKNCKRFITYMMLLQSNICLVFSVWIRDDKQATFKMLVPWMEFGTISAVLCRCISMTYHVVRLPCSRPSTAAPFLPRLGTNRCVIIQLWVSTTSMNSDSYPLPHCSSCSLSIAYEPDRQLLSLLWPETWSC